MTALLENQNIAKRNLKRRSSPNRLNYKSAVSNVEFITQFKQKPSRTYNTVSGTRIAASKVRSTSLPGTYRRPSRTRKEKGFFFNKNYRKNTTVENPRQKESNGNGFSFSIPSPVIIAIIAGTVLFSLLALNWEEINIRIPDKYSFQPAADRNTEQYTSKYAEFGIASIFPAFINSESESVTELETNEIPPEMIESFEWTQYKVQRGDSVSVIAQKFGISYDSIIASNGIRNARRLQAGAVLRIPNIDGIPYTVKKGDTIYDISASYKVPLEVILDVNDLRSDNIKEGEILFIPGARMEPGELRLALGDLFIYPAGRSISSHFGWRRDPFTMEQNFHTGIDFRADTGTPVRASMDGTASVVGNNRIYGLHIILSHGNGYTTLYAHLSAFSVKQGDRVSQGVKIGEVGSTGYSTGPHLHFGIFQNGKWVNPIDLLQ
jgi:murein DD-endopeptidase MepM/ murein hydrolase activator NlpD